MTSPVTLSPTVATEVAATSVATNFTLLFAALRATVVQQLLVMWFSQSEYTDATLQEWLDLVLPIVLAAQETSASSTFSYLGYQLNLLGIELEDLDFPDFESVTGSVLRNGADPEEVYSRPFVEVWTALSKGEDLETAIARGATRLRSLIETDIQLAHTHSSRTLLSQRSDVVGFRRVPTGDYTCALCLIASTQRYRKFDLMPIHPGCDCRVAPIISDEPVGQVVDRELLESIHTAVEEMFGFSDRSGRLNDFRKLLVVQDHGEYGPTLTKSGNKFTKLTI